jgi:hypothetical protein
MSTFEGVADSPVIMLAELILKRAGLKGLFVQDRAQAIRIIRGVKPAPPRNQPLGIRSAVDKPTPCRTCGQPIHFGEPCKTVFHKNLDQHIECPKKKALFQNALNYLEESCKQS